MEEKLYTWKQLNDKLRSTRSEQEVERMISEEQKNGKRSRWIHRMYARYGVLRKRRERKELRITA
jgi:hypothetical protein